MKPVFDRLLLLTQLIVAAAMTGIIWLVQIVIYPSYLDVGPSEFPAYHERYTVGISSIVGPLMILEAALTLVALVRFWRSPLRWILVASAIPVGVLWLVTFAVQVPQHDSLAFAWSETVILDLIAGNWIRTVLWSLRLALLGLILVRVR
ncbi:MAG: hypothetical protein HKN23_04525 [Verrucomicrobiales bacterium]|nr:hypothetical protein [Verrucomicrobiales bacterium]